MELAIKITATCSMCGRSESRELTGDEVANLMAYDFGGEGRLQDLFPNIPAWIRSGAIDKRAGGFCICPDCGG